MFLYSIKLFFLELYLFKVCFWVAGLPDIKAEGDWSDEWRWEKIIWILSS